MYLQMLENLCQKEYTFKSEVLCGARARFSIGNMHCLNGDSSVEPTGILDGK